MNDFSERAQAVKTPEALRAYADARLNHSRGTGFYECPACGSGTGKNGTGALHINGTGWRCFSCGAGGDVLDLVGIAEGINEPVRRLEAAESFLGITSPIPGTHAQTRRQNTNSGHPSAPQAAQPDYSAGRSTERQRIAAARAAMHPGCAGWEYAIKRGFTPDEIARYGLGYDEQRRRLVIPYSSDPACCYHIDRDVTATAAAKYTKPRAELVGPQPLFNAAALDTDLVQIVEGPLDALALNACGGNALALCGTASAHLVQTIRDRGWRGTAALMLDADEAGQAAAAKLAPVLKELGAAVMEPGQPEGCKDAAEALEMGGRDALSTMLREIANGAVDARERSSEARYAELCNSMELKDTRLVIEQITSLEGVSDPVPTGIDALDKAIGGGLKPGLTVLGAISSLGKTSLLVQVADAIAKGGRPVLFVTVEEATRDLVTKSLVRTMAEAGRTVCAADVLCKEARLQWADEVDAALADAMQAYGESVAPWLVYMEPRQQPTVQTIAAAVEVLRGRCNASPVVIIDYLQLLAPVNERDSDKRIIDNNMTALRQLARSIDAPVVAVSSLNRASYNDELDMTAFNGSSSIEYGADVLLVMQPADYGRRVADLAQTKAKGAAPQAKDYRDAAAEVIAQTKAAPVRELEIKVLKNRGGVMPRRPAQLRFNAAHCEFYSAPNGKAWSAKETGRGVVEAGGIFEGVIFD